MNVILMEVTHRDQILLFYLDPIFKTQAMVKTRKIAPLLSHLRYLLQILNRMFKAKNLRPRQTYLKMIVPNKYLSRTRMLNPHTNLYNIHHRDRTAPLRRLKITILLPRRIRKTNLVDLQAVNTIRTPNLILNNHRYTKIFVCKN